MYNQINLCCFSLIIRVKGRVGEWERIRRFGNFTPLRQDCLTKAIVITTTKGECKRLQLAYDTWRKRVKYQKGEMEFY